MEETKTNNLAKACFLLNEEWIDTLPEKVEPYKYSKQHNRNMQKLFSKMRKDNHCCVNIIYDNNRICYSSKP